LVEDPQRRRHAVPDSGPRRAQGQGPAARRRGADPRRAWRSAGALRAGRGGGLRPHRRIVQPGTGITIYPIQSPALQAFDDQPERWIDVRWDIDERTKERFPARVSVTAINAPGSLADIAQVVASNDANIHTLSMVPRARLHRNADRSRSLDLKHLNRLLSQLKDNSSVSDARRVNG